MLNLAIIVGLSAAVALLVVRNRYNSSIAMMYKELYNVQSEDAAILASRVISSDAEIRKLNEQLADFPVRGKDGKFTSKAVN